MYQYKKWLLTGMLIWGAGSIMAGELLLNGDFNLAPWAEGQAPFGWGTLPYNHRILPQAAPDAPLGLQVVYPASTLPTVYQAFTLPEEAQEFTVRACYRCLEPESKAFIRIREHRDENNGYVCFFDGSNWTRSSRPTYRTDNPVDFNQRYLQGDATAITTDHSAAGTAREWQEITFTVPRLSGVNAYRIELGASGANGDQVATPSVEWDNVSVSVDVPMRPLTTPDFQLKGAGIDADRILSEPPPYDAKIANINGVAGLTLNGKPFNALGWDCIINHNVGDQELFDLLNTTGFTLARFLFALGESFYHNCPFEPTWIGPDQYDWTYLDTQLARIRNANPEIKIMLKLALDGTDWWCEMHPDATTQLSMTVLGKPYGPTSRVPDYLSPEWRRDSRELVRQLIAHIASGPFADMVIGYCLFNGMSLDCNWEPDITSLHGQREFRQFLKTRYRDDKALRQAWNDPEATLATAVPDVTFTREMSRYPLIFAPGEYQKIADSLDFRAWCDAKFIGDLAHDVKEATHRRAVFGARTGNLLFGAWDGLSHGYGPSHNLGGDRLEYLTNPDFDFIDHWPSYPGRWLGDYGSFAPLLPNVGLTKLNKMYILQNDVRTHLSEDPGQTQVNSLAESLEQQKSIFCAALTQGMYPYLWQMSYHFNDPGMMPMWQKQREIFETSLYLPRQSNAEIAFVVDQELGRYIGRDFDVKAPTRGFYLIDYGRYFWARGGSNYDMIFLNQLQDSHYKVYVFYLTLHLDNASIQQIHRTLQENGATGIFVWNAGIIDGNDRFSLANMEKALGMELAISETDLSWQMQPTAALIQLGFPQTDRLGVLTQKEPCEPADAETHTYPPSVFVTDSAVTVLGISQDTGVATLVEKDFGEYRIIYSISPLIHPSVLRHALRQADGFEYLASDDILYLNASFVGVHTRSDTNKINLKFPEQTALYEVFRDEELPSNSSFEISVDPKSTYLWFRGSREEWNKVKR